MCEIGTIGTILGVLIVLNIFGALISHQWHSLCGWLVAGLEWTRRFTVG